MTSRVQFGIFELDRSALELRRQGLPVRVGEQPLKILAALVERPGQLVTRDQLKELIWGNDTFVDFETSLNKAVNRLREALNDDATRPRYVETVPRRGYRFIASVNAFPPTELSSAIQNLSPQIAVEVPGPGRTGVTAQTALEKGHSIRDGLRTRTYSILLIAISVVALITTISRNYRQKPRGFPDTKFVTAAANCCARLTRDGKLLAYVSPAGAGPPHIWVRQTAGGDAIQITRGPDGVIGPDFSPDGTHLVFVCKQGLCTAPTLSGEQKILLNNINAAYPVYSPDGATILYLDVAENGAMSISVRGGKPTSLSVNQEFLVHGPPIWSPDGDRILFYGVRRSEPGKPDGWWTAPLPAGNPSPLPLPEMETIPDDREFAARAWLRKQDGSDWIVYTAQRGAVWKMFRVQVSRQGEIKGSAEQLTFGVGEIGYSVSVADDGKVAYNTFNSRQTTYAIPIDDRGQTTGPASEVLLSAGTNSYSPSLSRDGKWLAYAEESPGKSNIVLTDLDRGKSHILDEAVRRSNREVGIAPDGSKVSFEQDCGNGRWQSGEPINCGFVVAAARGEQPKKVCESCIPRGFSADGSVLLVRKYDPVHVDKPPGWIAALKLASGIEKKFAASSSGAINSASFSWDDRWVIVAKLLGRNKEQIMIAPVRDGIAANEADWIAITDGTHSDGGPQFSANGDTAFYISKRDGYDCIWAQRLDPATKRPVGPAFGYQHFHDASQKDLDGYWNGDDSDLSVSRNKMIVNLVQWHVGIWMTQID